MENKVSFYNTLTRKVEPFIPNEDGKVAMYTCGPTVYHYAHIGNLRSYIMEDLLEKMLRYVGYDVTRVMNITDVGHLTSDADSGAQDGDGDCQILHGRFFQRLCQIKYQDA